MVFSPLDAIGSVTWEPIIRTSTPHRIISTSQPAHAESEADTGVALFWFSENWKSCRVRWKGRGVASSTGLYEEAAAASDAVARLTSKPPALCRQATVATSPTISTWSSTQSLTLREASACSLLLQDNR